MLKKIIKQIIEERKELEPEFYGILETYNKDMLKLILKTRDESAYELSLKEVTDYYWDLVHLMVKTRIHMDKLLIDASIAKRYVKDVSNQAMVEAKINDPKATQTDIKAIGEKAAQDHIKVLDMYGDVVSSIKDTMKLAEEVVSALKRIHNMKLQEQQTEAYYNRMSNVVVNKTGTGENKEVSIENNNMPF